MSDAITVSFESKCISYLSSVYEDLTNGIVRRSASTGFFWRHEKKTYLITNRHCVTGKNSRNRLFAQDWFAPTHLQIYFHERGELIGEGVHAYRWKAIEVSLFKDGEPEWFEHPLGRLVDVVAIALDEPDCLPVDCVNDRKAYDAWKPEAGADCYIVGYPEGLAGAEATPIWKRASIATEPE